MNAILSLALALPTSGPHGVVRHPLLATVCAVAAVALVVAFIRGYGAANPPETTHAIRRGDARPVWTPSMWLCILGAFGCMGLMLAL